MRNTTSSTTTTSSSNGISANSCRRARSPPQAIAARSKWTFSSSTSLACSLKTWRYDAPQSAVYYFYPQRYRTEAVQNDIGKAFDYTCCPFQDMIPAPTGALHLTCHPRHSASRTVIHYLDSEAPHCISPYISSLSDASTRFRQRHGSQILYILSTGLDLSALASWCIHLPLVTRSFLLLRVLHDSVGKRGSMGYGVFYGACSPLSKPCLGWNALANEGRRLYSRIEHQWVNR